MPASKLESCPSRYLKPASFSRPRPRVQVTLGEFEAVKIDCSPVEVEAVLAEILTGNAYQSDEVTQWVSQVQPALSLARAPGGIATSLRTRHFEPPSADQSVCFLHDKSHK
eukprot:6196105-Pleurochrysis_carterae.AAC.3